MQKLFLSLFVLFLLILPQNTYGEPVSSPDFDALTQECRKRKSIACCLNSLKKIKLGGYMLDEGKTLKETTCPKGYRPNSLNCPDSLRWCVPVKKTKKTKKKIRWFWEKEKACNLTAMVCPDGTTVGPTGPDCEFKCPEK